eukprot:s152_g3.t1
MLALVIAGTAFLAFQRGHYERNRRRFRECLAWDDPTRAGAVIQARKTLAKSDKAGLMLEYDPSWEDAQDQNALYPVTSLPSLRRESGKIFSELAQELREQLSALVESQLEAVSEAEKAVIHRWILREKTKDRAAPKEQTEGASESKPVSRTPDGCGSALHRLLANSGAYGAAIRGLDHQLRLSFKAMERRLQAVRKQLDPMFLSQSASLSSLYLNRSGLFQQILEAGSKDEPAKCIPAECRSPRPPYFHSRDLFIKFSDVASRLSPDAAMDVGANSDAALAALITESVEGQGQGAAALHRALASVAEGLEFGELCIGFQRFGAYEFGFVTLGVWDCQNVSGELFMG